MSSGSLHKSHTQWLKPFLIIHNSTFKSVMIQCLITQIHMGPHVSTDTIGKPNCANIYHQIQSKSFHHLLCRLSQYGESANGDISEADKNFFDLDKGTAIASALIGTMEMIEEAEKPHMKLHPTIIDIDG